MQAFRPARAGVAAALLVAGCSHFTEHQILEKYFAASRLRDAVVLRAIATVAFEPRRDGTVQRLRVVSAGEDRRRPVSVPRGSPLLAGPYPGSPDIDRLDRDAGISRADTREDSREDVLPGFSLAPDVRIAALSAFDPRYDRDLAGARGDLTSREVTIAAYLLPPQGEMRWETLAVRIERADVTLSNGERVRGRWIVTAIRRL